MEEFLRCFGIAGTLTFMCCIFSVFSQSDVSTISKQIGSTVTLHCNNSSLNTLSQLIWKTNERRLFSYRPQGANLHKTSEAARLNLNMSTQESQLYALIIESAQDSHTGNYTCETTTAAGVWDQKWKLIITEKVEHTQNHTLLIVVAIVIPVASLLIFIITFILIKVCKQRARNSIRPPAAGMEEDIYENCLEIAAHQQRYNPARYHKARAC